MPAMSMLWPPGVAISASCKTLVQISPFLRERERGRERERDNSRMCNFFYPSVNRQLFECHSIPWIACSLRQSEDEVEAGCVCPAPSWFCLKKPHLHTEHNKLFDKCGWIRKKLTKFGNSISCPPGHLQKGRTAKR